MSIENPILFSEIHQKHHKIIDIIRDLNGKRNRQCKTVYDLFFQYKKNTRRFEEFSVDNGL